MDQAQAKNAIDALGRRLPHRLITAYAARAKTLIDDPDQVNQGYYGTCGPAAALRALLLSDRAKFVGLTTAVFDPAAPVFNGIKAEPANLYEARINEIATKRARYPDPPDPDAYIDRYDFDFILASSLYTFLAAADDVLFRRQRDYSESIVRLVGTAGEQLVITTFTGDLTAALTAGDTRAPDLINAFELHGDLIAARLGYRLDGLKIKKIAPLFANVWTIAMTTAHGDREYVIEHAPDGFRLVAMVAGETGGIGFSTGDLALDQDGIKALMSQVVGMTGVRLVRRMDFSAEEIVRKALAKPNAFVVGLVKGYDEWNEASKSPAARTFDQPARPPAPIVGRPTPDIEHHLAVLGITRNGEYDDVDVWSWATRYTVKIRSRHLGSYFFGYLTGQAVP